MTEKIGNHLLVAGLTDVGRVRTLNEDSMGIDSDANLLILADGMGGHDAGEVASTNVVELVGNILRTFLQTSSETLQHPTPLEELQKLDDDVTMVDLQLQRDMLLKNELQEDATLSEEGQDDPTLDDMPNPVVSAIQGAISYSNNQLNDMNSKRGYPDGMGMGSTVVGLWVPEFSEDPVVFHVGDSRLYLLQRGRLNQITRDHSMYQQWVNFGSKGQPPAQNILLQAMGPSRHVTPDVRFLNVAPDDVVLLCSDGLTGMVGDKIIQRELAKATPKNLDKVCGRLVQLALDGGGKDNITVIVGYFL